MHDAPVPTFRTKVREAVRAAGTAAEQGAARYDDASREVRRAFVRARNDFEERREAALRSTRRSARRATRYAQDHPWPIAGGAVAVGLLVGALIVLAVSARR